MNPLNCQLLGFGAWGPGFENWAQLTQLLRGDNTHPLETSREPKPDIIPANERRRAPLSVRMAIESSWQATQTTGIEPKNLSCVFVSGLGDTQLTDYMCNTLASENKHLSPTKFHNSVHNAAAGYWTISTGCMKSANSVAGFNESTSLTLLEAMSQCALEQEPILLTFYDVPSSEVLRDLYPNEHGFSASLIIAPPDDRNTSLSLSAEVLESSSNWPSLSLNKELQACYENNPAARVLLLLNALCNRDKTSPQNSVLVIPLSIETSLKLTLG